MITKLLPFYFPTSVVLVDDDPIFLKHFSLLLDPQLSYHLISSPQQALEFINERSSINDSLGVYADVATLDNADEQIFLNTNSLQNHIYNSKRFAQISIVIVDYSMPGMDGLEFCRRIKHPEIKCILLTGRADEKTAIKAFNEGIIQRFFLKSSTEVDKEINEAIIELQQDYFDAVSSPFLLTMTKKYADFLVDEQFKTTFQQLLVNNNWVEFYLWDQPRGMVLLDADGNSSFLFVSSKSEIDTHYEVALGAAAPPELLRVLSNGKHAAWFPTQDGHYTPECTNWKEYIYPAEFLFGNNNTQICSLVSPCPIQSIDMDNIRSYSSYLAELE